MTGAPQRTILVVGGSGYFGRLLVEDLLAHTPHHVIITARSMAAAEAARNALLAGAGAAPDRIESAACSLEHQATVATLVRQCDVAVCAAGPSQHLGMTMLDACVEHHRPYVDLSDDRAFVRRLRARLAESSATRSPPPVCTAWAAVSALSCALARIAAEGWPRFDRLRICLAPGNRQPRNRGTVASLLHSLGRTFTVPCGEGEIEVTGWSRPRDFPFPPPVGTRRAWLVDVPDHDLAAEWLNARSVEFRVGAELALLNRAAATIAWLRRRRLMPDPARWAGLCCRLMGLLGSLGSEAGGLGVEAAGVDAAGQAQRRRASIVADRRAPMMAVMPATIMIQRWLNADADARPAGLVRHDDWIDRAGLERECARRGFRLHLEAAAVEDSST